MSATVATVKLCAIEGCGKAAKNGRGRYCSAHSERRRLYGDPLGRAPVTRPWRSRPCVIPGCDRPNRALGLCKLHVRRAYAHGGDPLGGRWTESAIAPGVEATAPVDLLGVYTAPTAPDPWPVRALRAELREQREQHVPFDAAWPLALALVGPDLVPWRDALDYAMPEWRAAYLGEPPVLSFGVPDPWHRAQHLDQVVDDLVQFL